MPPTVICSKSKKFISTLEILVSSCKYRDMIGIAKHYFRGLEMHNHTEEI